MKRYLADLLACPSCHGDLVCRASRREGIDIVEGSLDCNTCTKSYSIIRGIPRFVDPENYASTFGFQWNHFKADQIDSQNRLTKSYQRFQAETGWSKAELQDKWVLDAGCGAGRFVDVASQADCQVVGVDMSDAVDAAAVNLAGRENIHLVQASIYSLPFKPGSFDFCYCIGVIQHTPDPHGALQALPRILRAGGKIAVTIYERKPWTTFNTKYLIRPFTRRLPHRLLYAGLAAAMPVLFGLAEVLFRLPVLGRLFPFVVPVANYVHEKDLPLRRRYRWALLDTFDMLSPRYDAPQTESEVRSALSTAGVDSITRLANPGVNLIGTKTMSATVIS